MADFHGIKATEISDGTRRFTVASTAIIGLVVTAPRADETAFPLDTPVLVTDAEAAIDRLGAGGTARNVLRAIADQARPVIVLVRVAEGATPAETSANVIGATTAQGQKTGMQALLAAQARLTVKPKILGAPGLDTQAVVAALVVVAQKLKAMAYASAVGVDVAAAAAYRRQFGARELMLLFPDFLMTDSTGATVTSHAVARALGLRARIDQEAGFFKTLSNVDVTGVTGMTRPIQWDLTSGETEAGILNAADVTALVHTGSGYRFWGNRTCSSDPLFAFESATRTAHVLLETIGQGLLWGIDKPLRPSLAKDIVESINGFLRDMKREGALIGGRCWFDADKNPVAALSAGKLVLDYDYTPVPPLEALSISQRITDSYFADFAAGLS
ncbi:phage tail sheath subtilisin-like domain-containing protein [Sphingomonas morindae]|uniref:Phage tail sheath subtilisin-like domain-containing protein n=1 Tax=Sphingomonas morindae TaxID=1541170 RepID=A0ABY4X726_9SPHN|nr:phage tail sheath subtilisin-like domain-containing protein [Sphingomonas morindae]USI72699.1 phage tail sheath subtilisin-like domain-containing protein [Sphingomonas morindae]